MEAGAFLVIGTIFAVSSHIFPWYTAAFLPWIATQIAPLGIQWRGLKVFHINWRNFRRLRINWKGLKVFHINWKNISPSRINWRGLRDVRGHWRRLRNVRLNGSRLHNFNEGSLATISVWYFTCTSITAYFTNWNVYYQQVYGVTLLGLGIAIIISSIKRNTGVGARFISPSHFLPVRFLRSNVFRVKWVVGKVFSFVPLRHGKEKI